VVDLSDIAGLVEPHVPALLAMALVVGVVALVHRAIRQRNNASLKQDHLREQLLLLALWLVGAVSFILALPIGEETKGQLLTLFGILLTAVIGLASTTFVGNAMAGLMLKGLRGLGPGDFIRVEGHFGRITDRGLFHTEIQTEDRDLVTLPNLYLVTNPLRILRPSGTVIAAKVSLGYDVGRTRIEAQLVAAAEAAGLQDPFVQLIDLGDFSVVWRAGGILEDLGRIISTRSALRREMLDRLHADGIEIVSPIHAMHRRLDPQIPVVPDPDDVASVPESLPIEQLVFDKADLAASVERLIDKHEGLMAQVDELRARLKVEEDPTEITAIEAKLDRKKLLAAAALEAIEDRQRRSEDDD